MKKLVKNFFVFATLAILAFQISGCKKDCPVPTVTYPIQGLWEGTYTVGAGTIVPAGTQLYFSLSIYPDGKVSYKSKSYNNGSLEYINFADGTWTLNGTSFAYTVTSINYPGTTIQHVQTGTATYNSSNGTLTNGIATDAQSGNSVVWSMKRVN
jgi:hypothetical protein